MKYFVSDWIVNIGSNPVNFEAFLFNLNYTAIKYAPP